MAGTLSKSTRITAPYATFATDRIGEVRTISLTSVLFTVSKSLRARVALDVRRQPWRPISPPGGLSPVAWADYRGLCSRFLREQARKAQALGWTELELFALPPDARRPWEGGVLWLLAGDNLTEITADQIRVTSRAGTSHSLQRPHNLGALPWAVA